MLFYKITRDYRVFSFGVIVSSSDGGVDEDTDFVFEEFVRLRVAGADDNTETDA